MAPRATPRDFGVEVQQRDDLAIIAVQGPQAREKVAQLLIAGRRAGRAGAGNLSRRARSTAGSSRAPATPARTASRSCCRHASAGACGSARRPPASRLRARRARHAAARSRHEPLRPGHGRDHARRWSPAWPGPWPSSPRRATSSAARRSSAIERAAAPRKLVGLVLEERGVLRAHQKVCARRTATARSRAAASRRR